MPKGFPIDYEMAEKNANTHTHTDTHFRIYISRDNNNNNNLKKTRKNYHEKPQIKQKTKKNKPKTSYNKHDPKKNKQKNCKKCDILDKYKTPKLITPSCLSRIRQ